MKIISAISYSIAGMLLGSLGTLSVTSGAVPARVNAMMGMMDGRGRNAAEVGRYAGLMTPGSVDRHFIEQMIPHHEDAVLMAEMALEQAQRPEVRTLAQDIITAQESEISRMNQWYREWYGEDVPRTDGQMGMHGMMGRGSMHMGMMGNDTDMDRLSVAQDFDKAFIEEMIPHHQMAVMMASMLKAGTNRGEMKQLADNIITSQTKEIQDMRRWYQTWYR